MIKFILFFVFGLLFEIIAADVRVPEEPPRGASQVIDHAFAGVAMKSLSWPNYTSTFSQNLYKALSHRTGTDLIIRIGGTSMDHTIYDLNQEEPVIVYKEPHAGLRANNTLGRQWFDTFGHLDNVSFILQFGFARDHGKNYTEAVGYIQNVLNKIGGCESPQFQAVELGNEPNLYAGQKVRDTDYSVEDYAHEAASFVRVLRENISCLAEGKKFQVFQKSSNIKEEGWSTADFMTKAPKIINFDHVKSVAQHFYCTQESANLQETLLNHNFTVGRTNEFFRNATRLVQDTRDDLRVNFILDEVANADVKASDEDLSALSKSLGSAVWAVDWMLYAMSINITRINMQNGAHMSFAEWLPTKLQGGWYGHVAVADFIGNDTENHLQVHEIGDLSSETGNKHLVGYAGYEHGKIAKVALLNLQLWNGTRPKDRPLAKVHLRIDGLEDETEVTVRHLTGPNGIATSGLTWDGLDWPFSKQGRETRIMNDTRVIKTAGSALTVSVNATEAILLTW